LTTRDILCLLLLVMLSGCGSLIGGPTSTPDRMAGTVILTAPPEGAVIYASALYIAGTLDEVPEKALLVRLVKPDGAIIAQSRIDAVEGEWSTEIIHGYSGEPTPVTVEVVPATAAEAGVLASRSILFGTLSERPEGAFINLITPQDGIEVGGDEVMVMGTASGLEENTLLVELIDSAQTVLDSEAVTLAGRYPIDEIPWSAALMPGEYRGNAVLRVTGGEIEQRITVIVTDNAG
jgi:hypothetical protein